MTASLGAVIAAVRERASALAVGLSLATVTLATGFISYTHISALTIHEGGSWKSAHLYPLAVDGQIAAGMVVLMEVKTRHRWWGLAGFVPPRSAAMPPTSWYPAASCLSARCSRRSPRTT